MKPHAVILVGTVAFLFLVNAAKGQEAAPLLLGSDANGKTVDVKNVSRVVIALEGNITTGYGWDVLRIEGAAVRAEGKVEYVGGKHPKGLVGGGGTFRATFRVIAKGKATVTMVCRRPWEKEDPAETFTVTLNVPE